MQVTFHPDLEIRLRELGRAAAEVGVDAYAVGGVVRDAIHGHENKDLDITVVGDALRLYGRYAEEWPGVGAVYPDFGTATFTDADGFRVDFVTARTERYHRPGSLPAIRPANLHDDLARRDFTVNAIAAALSEERFGALVDPLGGRADLEAGTLRILNPRSFRDDPTRLFRAARYATRLGLEPDVEISAAAVNAVSIGALRTISGERRRRETLLICEESRWAAAVVWLNRWGLWSSLHEGFEPRAAALARVDTARNWMERHCGEGLPDIVAARWLGFLSQSPPDVRRVMKALPSESTILEKAARAVESLRDPESGAWYRLMDAVPAASLMLALTAATSDPDKLRLTRYIAEVRDMALDVNGHDLQRAGIARGPAIRRALDRTLEALRTGKVVSPAEQLDYAVCAAQEEETQGA